MSFFLMKGVEAKNSVKGIIAAVFLSIFGVTAPASAITLTPGDAQVLSQSVIADLDYLGLREFFGVDFVKNNYSSSTDEFTYTGLLSGTYLGNDLEVNYFGDFSDFLQTGVIVYNSQGFLGNQEWSGAGTVQITENSENEFSFNLDSSFNVGSNTVSVSGLFTGTVNGNNLELTNNNGIIEFITQNGQESIISLKKPGSDLEECVKGERKVETTNTKEGPNNLLSRLMVFECVVVPKARLEFRKIKTYTVLNDIKGNPISEVGDGSIMLARAPEPASTLSLIVLGTLGAASAFKRKQK
jgi:hypothetical protein